MTHKLDTACSLKLSNKSYNEMKRRFSVRTVFSLVCELSQSRSGPSIGLSQKWLSISHIDVFDHLFEWFFPNSWFFPSGILLAVTLSLLYKQVARIFVYSCYFGINFKMESKNEDFRHVFLFYFRKGKT